MSDFEGRVVLVTGAAAGIGRAVAQRLAQDGATLILADRDAEGLAVIAAEVGAQALTYDAAIPGASAAMAAQAGALYGRLDAVLNIAGVYDRGPAEEVSSATWGRILQIDLTSVFEICQGAFPALKIARGAIVNTSSTAAVRGIAYAAPYTAAKAGVIGLTRALAAEWAIHGIRVNAVAPGWVRTAISANVAPLSGVAVRKPHEARLNGFAMGAAPEQIAGVFAYLASDAAAYITGEVQVVDGGAGLG